MRIRKPSIKNIKQLKANIKQSLAVVFFAIFTFALVFFGVLHSQYVKSEIAFNQQAVRAAIDAYKSELSEKLSILASSNTFIDYLRSGSVTREKLYPDFLSQIITLKSGSISGMDLANQWGDVIFKYGKSTQDKVTLNLCYLNQVLDSKTGDCEYTWTLFLDKRRLMSDIRRQNPSIRYCEECKITPLLTNRQFGSFNSTTDSNVSLSIGVYSKPDYYFYFYTLVMIASLSMLGAWCWFRLNELLNSHIVYPIDNLIACLKADIVTNDERHIDEINYLIREISAWRTKINKIKTDENNEKLAKIAAQLTHDIRSPLGAISMVLKKINSMIPEGHFKLMVGATHRIDEIAENFLYQYRNVDGSSTTLPVEPSYIPLLIDEVVVEKRAQFMESRVQLHYNSHLGDNSGVATINATEFKRVISNLINNAIEALCVEGVVTVSIKCEEDFLVVSIVDTGRGIPAHLLSLIEKGGYSSGKENGNGLGLSHARSMVSLWGGLMEITSVEGMGTTIILKLPQGSSPRKSCL